MVFIETTPSNLYDRMDPEYLHPERIKTIERLKECESVGLIELKKLSDLFIIRKKKTETTIGTPIPCIEMRDVDVDSGLVNVRLIDMSEVGTSLTECMGGQILFARLRPNLNKVVLIPPHIKSATCSEEFFVLSARNSNDNVGYIWLTLRSEFVLNQSKHLVTGAIRPRIDETEIGDIMIPILNDEKVLAQIDLTVKDALSEFYPAQSELQLAGSEFLDAIGLPHAPPLPQLFFGVSDRQSDAPTELFRMDPIFFHPQYYADLKRLLLEWASKHHGKVLRLGDLCEKKGIGKRIAKVKSKVGSVSRFGVENVTGSGLSGHSDHVEVANGETKGFLRKFDILITSTGTGSTGRSDIFIEDIPAVTDGELTTVRAKSEKVAYYILAYLKTEYAGRQLTRLEKGSSGQIHLYPLEIADILIPVLEDTVAFERAQRKVRAATEQVRASKISLNKARKALMSSISS